MKAYAEYQMGSRVRSVVVVTTWLREEKYPTVGLNRVVSSSLTGWGSNDTLAK